jgi:hypothetical protein
MQQAQYHAPKPGMEYLAAGLALLFPGAPIARLATQFIAGSQQGAQQRYEREQKQDDTANQNATAQYQYKQALIQRGIDPKTNKPFVLPPAMQKMADEALNPKAPLEQVLAAQRALAGYYGSIGATEPAKEYADDAKASAAALQKQQDQDRQDFFEMKKEEYIQAHEDRRAGNMNDIERARLNAQATHWANEEWDRRYVPSADTVYNSQHPRNSEGQPNGPKAHEMATKWQGEYRNALETVDPLAGQTPQQIAAAAAKNHMDVEQYRAAMAGKPPKLQPQWQPIIDAYRQRIENSPDPTGEAQKIIAAIEKDPAKATPAGANGDATGIQTVIDLVQGVADYTATRKGAWGAWATPSGGSNAAGGPTYPGP